MPDFLFADYNPHSVPRPIIESRRIQDVRDPKWGHPEFREGWFDQSVAAGAALYLPETPDDARRAANEQINASYAKLYEQGMKAHTCDIESVMVPGCPEEPDTQVEVHIYRPKNLAGDNNRLLFYCLGGALVMTPPDFFSIEKMCERFRCIAIVPMYRCVQEAKYPGAINDLHAAYAWMVEHAAELKADADNVVISGNSSGAHLSLAVAFRLRRYGYSPKGIVAVEPQTDERSGTGNGIYNGSWDSISQRNSLTLWLGENFDSPFIGPEALANHATVEDCIGYPPCFIHTVEFDPDRDFNREFYGKLLQARGYAEYHCWGGAMHDSVQLLASATVNDIPETPYSRRVAAIIYGNIEDCFQYDLRRPWVVEELGR